MRSAARQGFETGCAGLGGIAFLGMGVLGALGMFGPDLLFRLIGGGMFGFFGLFMLAGAASALQRGGDSRVAEVSATGAWLPEMEYLPWDEIAEVRLERIRGIGSAEGAVTQQIRRLGFVPRDPSRRAAPSTGLAWSMAGLYVRLLKSIAPQVRLGGDDPAPFGVAETDIPKDFDRLLETVGRFVTIGDASETRARERAARWTTFAPAASNPPADVATLDAALAEPRKPPDDVAPSLASLVAQSPGTAPPAASFSVPAIKPVEVLLAVLPVLGPIGILVPAILPMILGGGPNANVGLVIAGVVAMAFVIPGTVSIVRLARRASERRSDVARLRVGPDGIWTPSGGLVAWADVRAIRTEKAGWVREFAQPSVERWRLVVDPSKPGATAGTAVSDQLDARFDDVLDLVRIYHPVEERD